MGALSRILPSAMSQPSPSLPSRICSGSRSATLIGACALPLLAACAFTGTTDGPLQPAELPALAAAVEAYRARGQLPGATYRLEHRGQVHAFAVGRQTQEADAPPMTPETVFDAASLTKVVVTAPAILQLAEAGRLGLDDSLVAHVPECAGEGREAITLRHLLTHTSGLRAGLPARPAWQGTVAALILACREVPTHAPGSHFRYSDINFILLGMIVERASGLPLATYARERLFGPLGMASSGYLPLERMPASHIAPTQRGGARKAGAQGDLKAGQRLQGVVHDPTARFMGGVAGHAGLFTTAGDLSRFARMILGRGMLDGTRILSEASVALMREPQTVRGTGALRSLGWDIDSPYSRPRGALFPATSFGHTGFTGCVLWIDPSSDTFFVFLSNRVYPDDRGVILPLYSELGTLSARAAGLSVTP